MLYNDSETEEGWGVGSTYTTGDTVGSLSFEYFGRVEGPSSRRGPRYNVYKLGSMEVQCP